MTTGGLPLSQVSLQIMKNALFTGVPPLHTVCRTLHINSMYIAFLSFLFFVNRLCILNLKNFLLLFGKYLWLQPIMGLSRQSKLLKGYFYVREVSD